MPQAGKRRRNAATYAKWGRALQLSGRARASRVPACAGTTPEINRAMPATPADLFAFLDKLGIAHPTVTHAPLFTVEESQALRGKIPGAHTKNLFLKDKKGALFLITALEDAVIELKSLHRRLGATGRLSFGSAELMRETLGIVPGAVTPLAAMNDRERRVTVVLDAGLMAHEPINCHPLMNTMTTSIARADLVKFLEATGHTPRIAAVAEPGKTGEH
jgi:Ala-tRNA(Pro) deacylase